MPKQPNLYLYLIRHGEADLNGNKGVFAGRQNESPLTKTGERQADRVGLFLQKMNIVPTAVYSSPARRAFDTGTRALRAAGIDMPIEKVDALQELDRGAWTGRDRQAILEDEVIMRLVRQKRMRFKPRDGESMGDGYNRITWWADSRVDPSRTPDNPQHILAFTHSNITGCFAASVRGIQRLYTDRMPVAYGAMSTFAHNGRWQELAFNVNTQ